MLAPGMISSGLAVGCGVGAGALFSGGDELGPLSRTTSVSTASSEISSSCCYGGGLAAVETEGWGLAVELEVWIFVAEAESWGLAVKSLEAG
ncbi:hypothetical protein ABZP36_033621 [Zizania latifolia]